MTVSELIEFLKTVEDKDLPVVFRNVYDDIQIVASGYTDNNCLVWKTPLENLPAGTRYFELV